VPGGLAVISADCLRITDVGEIAGFGVNITGNVHAFLAKPSRSEGNGESAGFDEQAGISEVTMVVLTENSRKQLQKLLRCHLRGDRPLDHRQ
jgi:hypothetical protein